MHDLKFIPKILLCGDEWEFFSRVEDRPFKIVGHAKISGEDFDFVRDGKIFFDDKLQDLPALVNFLQSGAADYFLFTDMHEFASFRGNAYKRGFLSAQVVSLDEFNVSPKKFFYDPNADLNLLNNLEKIGIKTLLDVDGYFSRGRIFTKGNDFTEIDAVCEKKLPPMTENIYAHVYKNFADVGLKKYDAVLLVERAPEDFNKMLLLTENFSDRIITFARHGSELERHIFANANFFSEAVGLKTVAVDWYFLTRRTPPEDFKIFVVTHKEVKIPALPEGYEIIHGGHAQAEKTFGYLGDDTGENISRLNLFINELTALFWFWKNTSHTTAGLAHYRRFFTTSDDDKFSPEKILTQKDALKILERFDIIVGELFLGGLTQREFVANDCGKDLAALGEAILKKHLLKAQPDYLDAFEFVMNSSTFYKCNMFVARRNILDAFCKWLFSFLLDATDEAMKTLQLQNLPWSPRRLMSFLAERMLTVWLIKNRLRVKELKIMQVEGL